MVSGGDYEGGEAWSSCRDGGTGERDGPDGGGSPVNRVRKAQRRKGRDLETDEPQRRFHARALSPHVDAKPTELCMWDREVARTVALERREQATRDDRLQHLFDLGWAERLTRRHELAGDPKERGAARHDVQVAGVTLAATPIDSRKGRSRRERRGAGNEGAAAGASEKDARGSLAGSSRCSTTRAWMVPSSSPP